MRSLIRHRLSNPPPWRPDCNGTEAGDTLLEVLVALIIISLSVVALMGVLTTSITTSTEYRNLATADTVLKNFADALKYDVELQPTPLYANCAPTYQVVSEYPTTAYVGSGVTVFGTGFGSIGPSASWTVGLSQPPSTVPLVTIGSFDNGGPTVTSGGNVSATFTLQSSQPGGYIPPGAYDVTLSDGTSTVQSATMLTVTPSPSQLNPASGPDGTPVNVSASGFPATTALSVQVDGTPASTVPANASTDLEGNATVTFDIPPATPLGPQNVVVAAGGYTSTSTFTVTSTAVGGPGSTVTPPGSAVAGSTVQISSITYWNNITSVFDSACGPNDDSGIQLITLEATGASGVSDTLQLVVTDPTFGAPPGPTLAVTTSTTNPIPGQPISFTTTLTGSPSTCSAVCYPTGNVSWNITSTGGISPQPCVSTPIGPGSGYTSTATCTIPASQVTAGTYQVAVSYPGDIDYGPASGLGSITVPQLTPTMVVTPSSTNPVAGEPLTFTATVTGSPTAAPPTGTVTWNASPSLPTTACTNSTPPNSNSTSLGATSPPSATCTISGTSITSGSTYNMTATYSGDINYLPTMATSSPAIAYSVMLDSVNLVNQAGNTPGKVQSGDAIVVQFSGPVVLGTFCSAWTGSTTDENLTNGVVTVLNSNPDSVTITSASCPPTQGFGSLNLDSGVPVKGGNATYSNSTITWTAASYKLKITLGTQQLGFGVSLGTVSPPTSTSPIYTAGFLVPGSPFTINNEAF